MNDFSKITIGKKELACAANNVPLKDGVYFGVHQGWTAIVFVYALGNLPQTYECTQGVRETVLKPFIVEDRKLYFTNISQRSGD